METMNEDQVAAKLMEAQCFRFANALELIRDRLDIYSADIALIELPLTKKESEIVYQAMMDAQEMLESVENGSSAKD